MRMKSNKAKVMEIMFHDLPIFIERKKIKNMYLRVHPDGKITMSVPNRMPEQTVEKFLDTKYEWILMQREKMLSGQSGTKQQMTYTTGEIHCLFGEPYTLRVEESTGKNGVCFSKPAENIIIMRLPADSTMEQRKHLLEEWYRKKLKEAIPPLMEHYIGIVGRAPKEWRIKNMKTKWGTCNVVDKRIWLSLQLVKKDKRCLEYVIVHELTHLYEANHSPKFWALVEQFYPEWREARKLLNGR